MRMPRVAGWFAALVVLLAIGLARAAEYPSRPIKLVAGFPPGSIVDIRARELAERLRVALGQPVIVENKSGASGTIAAAYVARAPADGYTLYWATGIELASAPVLVQQLGYDPIKSFVPISGYNKLHALLLTNTNLGVKTVEELVQMAQSKPGKLAYGSSGAAATPHVLGALFCRHAKVAMTHVPYKGNNQSLLALVSGEVQMLFDYAPTAAGHIRAGKLVPLLVAGSKRSPSFPEVPTAVEKGFSELDIPAWAGIVAPAGTPREIIERLSKEIVAARSAQERDNKAGLEDYENMSGTPEQFRAIIRAEQARWKRIVAATGLKPE